MAGEHRWRWLSPRARADLAMSGIGAAAAAISYSDGLALVRRAGAVGRVDYLYPLLPDGLILICLVSLYDAARAKEDRPGWATAGVVLGGVLTVAQNLTAGLARSPMLALVDAIVPVVFIVAVEVRNGYIRRGRDVPFPEVLGDVPATSGGCPHAVAADVSGAARAAFEHARDCEREPVSKVELGARFGLSRRQVDELFPPVPRAAPPLSVPFPAGAQPAAANGDGPGHG